MKVLIALALTVLIITAEDTPALAPKEIARFEQMLDRPWQSLSLTMNSWLGDYWKYGPAVLVQKAPDETIIVSWIGGPEANCLPVVAKVLSKAEGEALGSKLSKMFRTGLSERAEVDKMSKEEVDAFIAKTAHTPGYMELVLRVADLDGKTVEMKTKLDTSDLQGMKGTFFEFMALEETLRPEKQANKSEQADGDKPSN
jgi:hypothetical protein